MNNKEIAGSFGELANLMELHEENAYKIRSYQNAYMGLRRLEPPIENMSDDDIKSLRGVGPAIYKKIRELLDEGDMQTLEKYRALTPAGVREMLKIKGFGPKKIRDIWQLLGIESVGELLYACHENRLLELKGFGKKSQEDLIKKLEYFIRSKDKFHLAKVEAEANKIVEYLKGKLPASKVDLVGAIRRKCSIVPGIEILVGGDFPQELIFDNSILTLKSQEDNWYSAKTNEDIPVGIFNCPLNDFGSKLFRLTGSDNFLKNFVARFPNQDFRHLSLESDVFNKVGLSYIHPELRDLTTILDLANNEKLPKLIEESDLKGLIHCHTTYSDGVNTLREMAEYAKELGYEYIVITDHSKSAFYANGLREESLQKQWHEIDQLNMELAPFYIFKGIESDILNDGSLDYADDILAMFDVIIASVHSNLKMDEEKATNRLIKAIENPNTCILGHMTGRLLLSREAYPIDHVKVLDACAANGVAVELNANPYRLDIDWRWIPYALEKGIKIPINPDAHARLGMNDVRYGVYSARKGGLTAEACLNTLSLKDFKEFLSNKFM